MQEIVNIRDTMTALEPEAIKKPFAEVLHEVQEYISSTYASVLKDNPDDNRELIQSYIEKYIEQKRVCVEDIDRSELCELLYGEMTGFSFLTKYLNRDDVEEINSATRS